jgi:exodeoxyribonuclease-3
LSDDLLGCATGCLIHKVTRGNDQPSDHAPVVVNLTWSLDDESDDLDA